MKIFEQLIVLCCSSILIEGIYSICTSPQYVEIGSMAIVDCFFPFQFNGVFWYHSSRTGDEVFIRLEKQPSGKLQKSGEGYVNGSFDILSNGSLVIRNVSGEYDTVFKVVLVSENYTVSEYIVKTVATIYSHQLVPSVNGCGNDDLCYISNTTHGVLNCTVHGARPAVNLKWYRRSQDRNEDLGVTVVTHSNGKYGFSSIASIDLSNFSSPLTVLKCKGFGIFLNSKSIEIDVIIENDASYHKSWLDASVTEKRVSPNSDVTIQCTNKTIPRIFLWKVLQKNSTKILMFSVFGNARYMEALNSTSHRDNGSIILTDIQLWQSKEIYTCVYAYGNGFAFTKVQLFVLEGKMSKDVRSKTVKRTLVLVLPVLLAIFLLSGIFIMVLSYRKRKKYQVIPEKPPQVDLCEQETETKEPTFLELCEEIADSILHWPFRVQPATVLFKEEVIEMFRRVSDDNEKNRKKKNIGVAAGSGAGILAGGLAITGAILAPFTFGASLGLTITGAVVGVGAASTSLGFTFDKRFRDKKRRKLVAPELESFISLQEDLAKIIVRLVIIYGMIDAANDLKIEDDDIPEDKNEFVVDCLRQIKKIQNSEEDIFAKIDHAGNYSESLMTTLKEALQKSVQHDRWWEVKMKVEEESPFDFLSVALTDILMERINEFEGPVSFIDFTEAIFLNKKIEDTSNNFMAAVTPGIVGTGRIAGGAMFATGRTILRAANIGDDAARIGGTVARFAQGVSIAGSVLSGLGIVVDIAFLGHAIYDLTREEKEDFSKALIEVADMMENINNVALQFTINPNENEEAACNLSESPC